MKYSKICKAEQLEYLI